MQHFLLLSVVFLCVGCAHDAGPDARESGTMTIAIGQPFEQARATAIRGGYEPHDASGLEMLPVADGFYIELPGGRGLAVYRNARRDVVASIDWIEHWPESKAARVYHAVQSFDLPLAVPAAR
jgi:hypothetical protein